MADRRNLLHRSNSKDRQREDYEAKAASSAVDSAVETMIDLGVQNESHDSSLERLITLRSEIRAGDQLLTIFALRNGGLNKMIHDGRQGRRTIVHRI